MAVCPYCNEIVLAPASHIQIRHLLEYTSTLEDNKGVAKVVHYRRDGVNESLKCPACSATYASSTGYFNHLKKKRWEDKHMVTWKDNDDIVPGGLLCKYCEEILPSVSLHHYHQFKRHRPQFDLLFFGANDELRMVSVSRRGGPNGSLACPICHLEFAYTVMLQTHVRKMHKTDQEGFVADIIALEKGLAALGTPTTPTTTTTTTAAGEVTETATAASTTGPAGMTITEEKDIKIKEEERSLAAYPGPPTTTTTTTTITTTASSSLRPPESLIPSNESSFFSSSRGTSLPFSPLPSPLSFYQEDEQQAQEQERGQQGRQVRQRGYFLSSSSLLETTTNFSFAGSNTPKKIIFFILFSLILGLLQPTYVYIYLHYNAFLSWAFITSSLCLVASALYILAQ